jgi:cell division septation protein DedD
VFQPEVRRTPEPRVPRALSGELKPPSLDDYLPEDRPGLEIYQPEGSSSLSAVSTSWRVGIAVSALALLGVAFGGWAYVRLTTSKATPAAQELKAAAPQPPSAARAAHVPSTPPAAIAQKEPPNAAPAAPAQKPASAAEGGSFAIQMATLQTSGGAARAIGELTALGYPAYGREVTLNSGGSAYAVFLGPYAEMTAAQRDFEQARQVPGYAPGRIVSVAPLLPSSPTP